MIHFVTASKDATVYSLYKTKNTGLDEILTVSKHYSRFEEEDNARAYLYFDITIFRIRSTTFIYNLNFLNRGNPINHCQS